MVDTAKIENLFTGLLGSVGEDPKREGLLETPSRVACFYKEVLSGYDVDPLQLATVFPSEDHNMVVVRDIDFYSLCEHHMVPFFGKVSVGYIPDKKILGLSKFGRIVDAFSKRLQVQERLTREVLSTADKVLDPLGCAVRIEATHLCMSMRGVKKHAANTVTTAFSGEFKKNHELRAEFMASL